VTQIVPKSIVGSTLHAVKASNRYARSGALLERARQVIPGGHHLSGRPLLGPNDSPLYMEDAKGCRIRDVDGNEYIDYFMAYGPFVLGYADPRVDEAVFEQAARGNLVSLNHPLHVKFAERLVDYFPGADMAIAFKTGSEATTGALRIARRRTGRRRVVRCGYHGWHDWCLPDEDFTPRGLPEQVLSFDANEPETLRELLARFPGEVAAVIVAPEMVRTPSHTLFAELLRETREAGAVFVMDEIKTCFRTSPGSFQEHVGILPDLTTVSKALGNGWPVAAVVGRRDVMQSAAGLHLSATYHGETTGMAAALATLDVLESEDVCGHVWKLGERLIAGLNAAAARHGIPALAYGEPLPPMPFLKFVAADEAINEALKATFYSETMKGGVLFHPRHLWFMSNAHSENDIETTLGVAEAAFATVAERHATVLTVLRRSAAAGV
jgi:glutamate-1-semialdehyde 2,1-aminomutase